MMCTKQYNSVEWCSGYQRFRLRSSRSFTLLYRKFLATVAASLLVVAPSRPKVIPLGTITHAERAYLGEVEASVGSTIFDGDRLSTDIAGVLRISSNALTLQLDARSSVILHRAAAPEANVHVELGSGNIIFSAGQASNIAVLADGALIRPASHTSTMAHIRITSPKELRIYAQRGALDFSYHGQSAVIPEGSAYRVLLDPPERGSDAASTSDKAGKKIGKIPIKFILVGIGIAAGVAIPLLVQNSESPDRPGPLVLRKAP